MLSDLYAMGVVDCDNMLMLLGVSTKMTEKERDVVVPLIMRGFKVWKWVLAAESMRRISYQFFIFPQVLICYIPQFIYDFQFSFKFN